MTGSPTATERTAIRTGYAALHTAKSPNSEIVEQIVFALGAAGMLQSPETGAEMERLRLRVDEVERQYIVDTAALKQRVDELEATAEESRPVGEDPIAYELTPQAEPHTGDELIGCSALHCKRGEWFAKAEELGWQHGHMDTWLCPQCADAIEERAEILVRAGEPRG